VDVYRKKHNTRIQEERGRIHLLLGKRKKDYIVGTSFRSKCMLDESGSNTTDIRKLSRNDSTSSQVRVIKWNENCAVRMVAEHTSGGKYSQKSALQPLINRLLRQKEVRPWGRTFQKKYARKG